MMFTTRPANRSQFTRLSLLARLKPNIAIPIHATMNVNIAIPTTSAGDGAIIASHAGTLIDESVTVLVNEHKSDPIPAIPRFPLIFIWIPPFLVLKIIALIIERNFRPFS